jgi:hypothetical protein
VNETNPSINAREKAGLGISLLVLSGIVLLIVALLFGIHLYISEVMSPEIKQEDRSSPAPLDRSGQASDVPLSSARKPGEVTSLKTEVEGRDDVRNNPESGAQPQPMPALDEREGFVRKYLIGLSNRPKDARWIGVSFKNRRITTVPAALREPKSNPGYWISESGGANWTDPESSTDLTPVTFCRRAQASGRIVPATTPIPVMDCSTLRPCISSCFTITSI